MQATDLQADAPASNPDEALGATKKPSNRALQVAITVQAPPQQGMQARRIVQHGGQQARQDGDAASFSQIQMQHHWQETCMLSQQHLNT